ncbi:putative transporter [Pseudoloma neurophilia]|uniref:Putative transporter n=1 Tax=Pseudoloma neurophilia TaxID=146866 RepID=A0A0R0M445_9MICR|nr:putative transporter [Pseudoloma neurophilia]
MIEAIAFAQCIACLLFISYKSIERLQEIKYWFPFQDIARIVSIFILSSIGLQITKPETHSIEIGHIAYLFCTVSDFFGGFCLKQAYATTAAPIVVFISQLMFPMMSTYLYFIENAQGTSKLSVASFLIILVICCLINVKSYKGKIKNVMLGVFFAFGSNICYIFNILYQNKIVSKIGAALYLRNMSIYSVPVLFLSSLLIDYKNIPRSFKEITGFYKKNPVWIAISGVSLASFYIFGSLFIEKYGPTAFNIATLTTSMYFGLYNMFYHFNLGYTCGYVIAMGFSILLFWSELKK